MVITMNSSGATESVILVVEADLDVVVATLVDSPDDRVIVAREMDPQKIIPHLFEETDQKIISLAADPRFVVLAATRKRAVPDEEEEAEIEGEDIGQPASKKVKVEKIMA